MEADWERIECELRELLGGLEREVALDRARIEQFASAIRDGRMGLAENRVRSTPRLPDESDVDVREKFSAETVRRYAERGRRALERGEVAVAVLNGGMATRLGGVVKGVLEAIDGRSFLEIKLEQARRFGPAPFLAMNSFATHRETLRFLERRGLGRRVRAFLQSVSLRLTPEGELFRDEHGRVSPYAPGHGDFPEALRRSGLLRELERSGVLALILSNVDNLGADPDPVVVGYHLAHGKPLTAEVTRSEPGDAGGGPAWVEGRLQILESFRLPEGFDLGALPFVNTNTLLCSLPVLGREHPLTWFYVEKRVGGRTAVQMERLIGQLSAFVPTAYLLVPRAGPDSRYMPVKTPEDLEALRRDPALAGRVRASLGEAARL